MKRFPSKIDPEDIKKKKKNGDFHTCALREKKTFGTGRLVSP